MSRVLAALIAASLALPALAQDAPTLLEQRRESRLLTNRLEMMRTPSEGAVPNAETRLRNYSRQAEARQREWQNATAPEYRRRVERQGRAAANAWIRTEAERFDAGEGPRLRETLR